MLSTREGVQLYYNCDTMSDMDKQSPSSLFVGSSRQSTKSASRLISVRLPEELLERLADVGNEQGLSMSDTIRLVLERGIRAAQTPKGK